MGLLRRLKILRNEMLRQTRYRKYKIGTGFRIGPRARLWAKSTMIIGRNFYLGRDSFVETNAIIGNNVIIANKVAIVGKYDHNFQQVGTPTKLAMEISDPGYDWKGLNEVTIIEDDVWIGCGSTVLSGVTIGEGSIIGAGSVVTKNVEPYFIYVGNPARKYKPRFENVDDLQEHLKLVKSKYSGKL